MTAQIISGTELSKKIKSDVASKIVYYRAQGKRAPGLAVILVGADPASQVYVGPHKLEKLDLPPPKLLRARVLVCLEHDNIQFYWQHLI